MNEKELIAYQKKMMSGAKGTMKLGIVTGVGSLAVGSIGSSIPGSTPVSNATNSALNLAAVGNMAAVGMSLIPEGKKKKTKFKW